MQSLRSKLLALFLTVALMAICAVQPTYAAVAPEVKGEVKYSDGTPIPNVWVKWVDKNGSVRYTKTDATGQASFTPWQLNNGAIQAIERATLIDLNYDGVPETPQAQPYAGYRGDAFGCAEDPHTFSVVLPPDMREVVTEPSVTNIQFPNNTATFSIPALIVTYPTPPCPGNRRYSCDLNNSRVTLSWDTVPGATQYTLQLNKYPFGNLDLLNGDLQRDATSNQSQMTLPISLNTSYQWGIKTVSVFPNKTLESSFCPATFACLNNPTKPTGTLSNVLSCVKSDTSPGGYKVTHNYTMSNIDLHDMPFSSSEIMLTFKYSEETKQIMYFLNGSYGANVPQNVADYSQWKNESRSPQDGDWFIFTINKIESLSESATQYSFTLSEDSKIGLKKIKTVRELKEFLIDNPSIPKDAATSGNLVVNLGGVPLSTSYIPAAKTRFVLTPAEQVQYDCDCDPAERTCNPEPPPPPQECSLTAACVGGEVVTVSEVVIPDEQNQITLKWKFVATPPQATVFDVVLYNKDVYTTAEAAYAAWKAAAVPAKPKNVVVGEAVTGTAPNYQYLVKLTPELGRNLGFAVKPYSASCTDYENSCELQTVDPPEIGYTVSGKFYDSSTCQTTTLVDVSGSVVSAVPVDNTQPIPSPVSVSGDSFTMTITADKAAQYQYSVALAGVDYICASTATCRQGTTPDICNFKDNPISGENANKDNINFFVQREGTQYVSWWQVWGGLVFGSTRIASNLPLVMPSKTPNASCDYLNDPYCQPYLIRREFDSQEDELTAGVPITNGNFNELVTGWWNHRADRIHAEDTQDPNKLPLPTQPEVKENYEYFKKKFPDVSDTAGGTVTTLTALGSGQTVDDAQVLSITGDVTLKPQVTQTISSGQKRVILINGNLTLKNDDNLDQILKVEEGGFLMFVVSGNIFIDSKVGHGQISPEVANPVMTPNLEGIYIANNEIIIQSNGTVDSKFIGAGIFVGWNNVKLERSFDNPNDSADDINRLKNTNTPVESFIFRPDLVVNAPTAILDSQYTWKEVN